MAKNGKDIKFSKAAHIKRRTEGTSNELSFSVLDAKKNQADVEAGLDDKVKVPFLNNMAILSWRLERKTPPPTPIKEDILPLAEEEAPFVLPPEPLIPLDPLDPSVSSASVPKSSKLAIDPNSAVEIEKRKTRRKRGQVSSTLVALALLIGVVVGGSYYLYSETITHRTQVSFLEESLDALEKVDKDIVAMDEIVTDLSTANKQDIEAALLSFEEITSQLDRAESLADEASSTIRYSAEKEAAQQVEQASRSRKEMIKLGEPLLWAELEMRDDIEQLEKAWTFVLEADAKAREAAEVISDTTSENVQISITKNEEAQALFQEGKYLFEMLPNSSNFTYDIQPLLDYIAKRIEALSYAIASDRAIFEQNRVEAQIQNEAYTIADEEASSLAKELPGDMDKMVEEAFDEYVGETYEQYKIARQRASTADAFLRDYLGT